MLRSCALAVATLLIALPASAAGSSSGGAPVSATENDPAPSSSGGATTPINAAEAMVAQEPEPDPDDPGQEQPDEPGGEPQPPSGDDPQPPIGDVPVELSGRETPATGGTLPRTGLEALQLALLGLVLGLMGARLRALARRPRSQGKLAADGLPHAAPAMSAFPTSPPEQEEAELEYDEYAHPRAEDLGSGRDEWSLPEPYEPAPAGLLPSTAGAKRKARQREAELLTHADRVVRAPGQDLRAGPRR